VDRALGKKKKKPIWENGEEGGYKMKKAGGAKTTAKFGCWVTHKKEKASCTICGRTVNQKHAHDH